MININQIICGNCVDVLKNIDDCFIDLTLTSPPYDNLRKYNGYQFPLDNIISELYRITKNGGVIVWIVADATINGSETLTSFKTAIKFVESGFKLHDTMIFKKINPIPQIYRKRYRNEFEYMFVFSKGSVKTCNPIIENCKYSGLKMTGSTYKNYSNSVQNREKKCKPVKNTKIKGNIWEYVVGVKKEDKLKTKHPAPFPYQLAYDHIISWTDENDIVLDPMCGSGTTCIASKNLKRNYIGIDISKEYCDIARERLKLF